MPGEKTAVPVWQENLERWDSLEGGRLRALLIEYAPPSAFPGSPSYTFAMLAALCPRESVSVTSPDELRRKLAEVIFRTQGLNSLRMMTSTGWRGVHSTGSITFSPASPCAGWPEDPVYVLDARPAWFDED